MLASGCYRNVFKRLYATGSLDHLVKGSAFPGLFSDKGLQTAWFDRIEYYRGKLNKYSNNVQDKSLEAIITEFGNSVSKRNIVNYASLLYNLEFAMTSLQGCPKPLPETIPDRSSLLKTPDLSVRFTNEPLVTGNSGLQTEIESSFGSIVQFRTLLLASNMAISGDGFTWLLARKCKPSPNQIVQDSNGNKFDKLFVLNTYNAGSPFTLDRTQMINTLRAKYEEIKKEEENTNSAGEKDMETINTQPDSFSNNILSVEEAKRFAFDNTSYIPLLAIDASPKTWLQDYGVFGKQEYLDRVWESINWTVVESRLPEKSNSNQI